MTIRSGNPRRHPSCDRNKQGSPTPWPGRRAIRRDRDARGPRVSVVSTGRALAVTPGARETPRSGVCRQEGASPAGRPSVGLKRPEAAVVIFGVVVHLGGLTAGDDAPGATGGLAGRLHGVLAIITAGLFGQVAFAVEK